MGYKSNLDGRMEKRIPVAIVVRLTHAQDQPANGAELTCTDNVSAHGARVVSSRPWQPGELAQVTSLKDEITIRGKVVYCQKLLAISFGRLSFAPARLLIGFDFPVSIFGFPPLYPPGFLGTSHH